MDDRLSPIEAIMWRVGQDPTLRMTVGAVMILDGAPSHDALAARLAAAVEGTPRLQFRPDDPTFTRARPFWVDDGGADIEHHLRSAAVGPPGSLRQVLDLVALLEPVPFDPDRPPWDVTLIEGVEGGRAALYLRAHHVVADGLGGMRLAGQLLDEPGWPRTVPSPSPARPKRKAAERDDKPSAADHGGVEPDGDEIDLRDDTPPENGRRARTVTIDLAAAAKAMGPLKAIDPLKAMGPLKERVNSARNSARDLETLDVIVRGVQRALDVANSVSRQVMVTGGPLSPLLLDRSMMSRFEVISVPGARAAALAFGGSRNDLLVAAAAAALGLYHERLGNPCPELRLATPAGQRRAHEVSGNWFAPARVTVPTTAGYPGPHFGMVAERLAQARGEPALRLTTALASTISRLPTRMLLPALHAQADAVDFAATALPGFRGLRHLCGSRVETCYPFGPRLGCPVNLTAFGNDDRLDVGVALDPAAITEPAIFLECLGEAFGSFVPAEKVLLTT